MNLQSLRSNVKGETNSMLETKTNCGQLISSKRWERQSSRWSFLGSEDEINWLYMFICFWLLPCYLLLGFPFIVTFASIHLIHNRRIMRRHSTDMNAHFLFTKTMYYRISEYMSRLLHYFTEIFTHNECSFTDCTKFHDSLLYASGIHINTFIIGITCIITKYKNIFSPSKVELVQLQSLPSMI